MSGNNTFMEDYIGVDQEAERALQSQEDVYKSYLINLQQVAATDPGKNVICTLLEALGTFEPAWAEKTANMVKRAVLKDFGNDILDDLAVANPNLHDDIQRMMRVKRKLANVIKNPKQ